jgi:hypothetical protein
VDQEYPKTHVFEKQKNHPNRKNSKTFRNLPKIALRRSTTGL